MTATDSGAMTMLGGLAKATLVIKRAVLRAGEPPKVDIQQMTAPHSAGAEATAKDIFSVQYNPSSLQITANATPVDMNSMQKGETSNTQKQSPRPPSYVLSVQLTFDAVRVYDAFDHLVGGELLGTKDTVQPQIEGLIAAMLNNDTRQVAFYWGGMKFAGQVNQIDANYTMFAQDGDPIRGTVQLQITQTIETGTSKYWSNALKRL